jgi:arginyl-tRNA synthetase
MQEIMIVKTVRSAILKRNCLCAPSGFIPASAFFPPYCYLRAFRDTANTMIEEILRSNISAALKELFQAHNAQVAIEPTSADYIGDFTFVVFPYLKQSRKGPEQTASAIGEYLRQNMPDVASFNVIKGFLNLSISDSYWIRLLENNFDNNGFAESRPAVRQKILVEYSSPNTNKPLHLGHVRNIFLGYSIAQILKANGHEVYTCNLVNDRGIHICKSMLAWQKKGNGETPQSSGIKGDHLVGKYYVEFDKMYKQEQAVLIQGGMSEEEAAKQAPSILEAQEMLRRWEANDPETRTMWATMNGWVYEGFETTYKRLGVSFDTYYYESDTYLLGKEIVAEGLDSGVFFKKEDGSVWIDLTADGLDEKLLLRADGTSVYITQDIGTAQMKYDDFHCERSVYVVGNEQDYHFKVLQLICKKLGKPFAAGIYHLSYGMVELPAGKMKSREGTVVDADDLMNEMTQTAEETTKALGKTVDIESAQLPALYEMLGMGALKYFLLRVEPRKKMMFNPAESIDFHGNTGPFIQYTHARIRSVLRNAGTPVTTPLPVDLLVPEKALLRTLHDYPATVRQAGNEMSPAVIANYSYELSKKFNQFYHELSILKEEDPARRNLRILLSAMTANVLQSAFGLLGIGVPEKM